MEQERLEKEFLCQVFTTSDAMIRAEAAKVAADWFVFAEENEERSYTSLLFELGQEYFRQSDGLLITLKNLGEKLAKHGTGDRVKRKLLALFGEIKELDSDPNDFHMLLEELKERVMMRLYGSALTQAHETMTSEGVVAARTVLRGQLDKMDELDNEGYVGVTEINVAESSDYFETEIKRRRAAGDDEGIMCGMREIDDITQGFRPGQFVVTVARSSGGKSILLLNWSAHAHLTQKQNVLYFSLEMPAWQCYLRHISYLARPKDGFSNDGVTHKQLKSTKITDEQIEGIKKKLQALSGGAYFVYADIMAEPTAAAIERKIRLVTRELGRPDVIVVDYVGKMTSADVRKHAALWERSAQAGIEIDRIAKKYQIVALTAAQLSKSSIGEQRRQKQEGKSALVSMDQDMVAGAHQLVADASYVFGFDSNREASTMTFFSMKMREGGWLVPFQATVRPEHNFIQDPTENEVLEFRQNNGLYTGLASPDATTAGEASDYSAAPFVRTNDNETVTVGAPGGKQQYTKDDLTFELWDGEM
ncbi:MAG: AAA family ATPase [Armatimonadetes bacterium]|nr:AAA family ATPase [Armatimonadota bacterium]